MKSIVEIKRKLPYTRRLGINTYGSELRLGKLYGSVVFSDNESGWEHVSFSDYNEKKVPSWEEMCQLKDFFWNDDEEVIQIHPKKSEYVNIRKNCLHLWRNKHMELPN